MEDRFGSMVLINAARRGERELREQCFCLRIGFAAARFIAERGVFAEGVPVLVRLIAQSHAEARRASGAGCWRTRRRDGELRVHRSLPGRGAGSLRSLQA